MSRESTSCAIVDVDTDRLSEDAEGSLIRTLRKVCVCECMHM